MNKLTSCVVAIVSALLAPTLSVILILTAPAVEAATDLERWFVVKISDSPVGFASEVVISQSGTVIYRSHTDLSMERMGTPLDLFMMIEEITAEDGTFQKASLEMDASITGMKAWAELRDGTIYYSTESGGATREREIPWLKDAVSTIQSQLLTEEWLAGDEQELRYIIFNINDGTFKHTRVRKGATRDEMLDGRKQTLRSIEEYEGDADVPTSITWIDSEGEPVRTVIRQMGLEVVVERISMEQMASIELEPNFDIIRQSMIEVKGYPDPPSNVQDVTMRLQLPRPIPADRNFDGPNQKVVSRGEDWIELLISRDTVVRWKATKEELAIYLDSDQYIQSDAVGIIAVADSIRDASGLRGSELAHELSAWVYQHIEHKDYSQGFASALEVLETRAGDCTEHSMLLTALLRAAGIPARPTVGLVYYDGQFIGHMWTEAYVDHWATFDALDQRGDPVRIRITSSNNGRAVDEKSLVQAYSVVGGMSVLVTAHNSR